MCYIPHVRRHSVRPTTHESRKQLTNREYPIVLHYLRWPSKVSTQSLAALSILTSSPAVILQLRVRPIDLLIVIDDLTCMTDIRPIPPQPEDTNIPHGTICNGNRDDGCTDRCNNEPS